MLFDKYLIGEYHMIKTIVTFTQTTPSLSEEILDGVLTQCAAWQAEGKYTGEANGTYNDVTGARYSERWEWIDNNAAQSYQSLVVSSWINIYPDIVVNIVVE